MIEIPVHNLSGKQVGTLELDEQLLGGEVRPALLKQAYVRYHANRRLGTVRTKSRGDVEGSGKKLYRQKGTGNARRGNIRTNILRGGSMAFRKDPRDMRKDLPRKMRRAALKSAILAKLIGQDLLLLDGLEMDAPKAKAMASVMKNLQINRSCLLALAGRDRNVYLSSRNLPDLTVRIAEELNAFDVATRQKMVVTTDAMKSLMGQEGQQ